MSRIYITSEIDQLDSWCCVYFSDLHHKRKIAAQKHILCINTVNFFLLKAKRNHIHGTEYLISQKFNKINTCKHRCTEELQEPWCFTEENGKSGIQRFGSSGPHITLDIQEHNEEEEQCGVCAVYFWVMGKEFWSISSPTFSWRMCTTSARMKTCVSSRSWMMNFFPRAEVSSRYRRNCFIAGSLWVGGRKWNLIALNV